MFGEETVTYPPRIVDVNQLRGIIKQKPRDFMVSEILPNGQILDPQSEQIINLPGRSGLFLHFVLVKKDISTESALSLLSKLWSVPISDFGIAGTKDKRALTAQRVSLWGVRKRVEKGSLKPVDLPKLKTHSLCFRMREQRLGNLWGNKFDITIRNLKHEETAIREIIHTGIDEISRFGGVPNAFGYQRFGKTRPITHIVGRKLLENNVKEAVRCYIGTVFENEPEEAKKARMAFLGYHNPEASFKRFPTYLKIERKMLRKLVETQMDYIQAFNSLSYGLRKLFIHAYQSALFNQYLKIRMDEYDQLFSEPLKGEVKRDGEVYAPIIGSKVELKGDSAEIYQRILEHENISLKSFDSQLAKKLGAKGTYRNILMKIQDLNILNIDDDELNENMTKTTLDFKLKKGSYATVVLKEFFQY